MTVRRHISLLSLITHLIDQRLLIVKSGEGDHNLSLSFCFHLLIAKSLSFMRIQVMVSFNDACDVETDNNMCDAWIGLQLSFVFFWISFSVKFVLMSMRSKSRLSYCCCLTMSLLVSWQNSMSHERNLILESSCVSLNHAWNSCLQVNSLR
jgi:hypothetical protein